VDWRPSADLDRLAARAALFARIRGFFAARHVLEVDTPLLCSAGVTDPAIEPLTVERGQSVATPRYLQSSPEYAMKRLLAAGSGPIYQLGKAFRDGEAGRRHNPEFTLLEWYRPGFDSHQLMAEVAELVGDCLGLTEWRACSYRELFQEELQIDPLVAEVDALRLVARSRLDLTFDSDDRDLWLDLLLSHCIEPGLEGLCFIYDYPASQAALSQVHGPVARRFELYVDGVELANGYQEETDADVLRQRFEADNRRRTGRGQPERPLDERLLAAHVAGLPSCSGVALGVDRLLAVQQGVEDIRVLMPFDWQRS
jgi:lysyl-tRNA synthetase class 2